MLAALMQQMQTILQQMQNDPSPAMAAQLQQQLKIIEAQMKLLQQHMQAFMGSGG